MSGAESSATTSNIELPPTHAHALARDEDVLSLDAQHALEGVGSALGVIAAFVLMACHLARAGRVVARVRATRPAKAPTAVPHG